MGGLATWRVTHLLAAEDGPGEVVTRLRIRLGDGLLGEAMDCFMCLSVWVSLPIALSLPGPRRTLPVRWLALSGAACLMERVAPDRGESLQPKGVTDGLLWPEAPGIPG
jgi:hypothetical protein